jgi:hypothetical protein
MISTKVGITSFTKSRDQTGIIKKIQINFKYFKINLHLNKLHSIFNITYLFAEITSPFES